MPDYFKSITYLLSALLLFTGVQAETTDPDSGAATARAAETTTPERHGAGQLNATERLLLELDAGAELMTMDLDEETFFLIFRPAVAPVPVGNLLILPDLEAGESWARQSRAMSRYLAEHGWNTLSLQPPRPQDQPLPTRTLPVIRAVGGPAAAATAPPAPEPSEDPAVDAAQPPSTASNTPAELTDNAEQVSTTTFSEQVDQRLSLALAELERRSHTDTELNVLLAIGSSAPWAAQQVIDLGEEWDLVLFDPRPSAVAEADLVELLPKIEGRIIDLHHLPLPGYPDAAPDARLRRQLAIRHDMTEYHQIRLSGVFKDWQTEMPREVRLLRGAMERVLLSEPEAEVLEPEAVPETEAPPGLRTPGPGRGPGAA